MNSSKFQSSATSETEDI